MSAVTISGTHIRLWCLVRGNNNPFKVVIGQDNDIDDLKKVIKEEKQNVLSKVDVDDIILWNVKIDQSQLNIKDFSIEEILTDENKLFSANLVKADFSDVEGTNIRVIVGATGKL
jgi:hypothetical protein